MNWEKYVFHWEKSNFKTLWKFCTYRRIFNLRKDPANILTSLSPILIMQISAETDNHKYRNSAVTMSLRFETLNLIFYAQ